MISEIVNPSNIKSAEIVVGIPSYNEADSIFFPVEQASKGLNIYFPHKSSVIVNVDNCSEDGTKDAFLNTPTKVPKIYASTEKGVRGVMSVTCWKLRQVLEPNPLSFWMRI